MCGRYVIVSKIEKIEKQFNVKSASLKSYIPNFNVSHGDVAPVITSGNPMELSLMCFGFTPAWAKKKMYVINARAEGDLNKENSTYYTGGRGIINKPMFKDAIRKRRCIIPANAFYEGSEKERLNKPYVVYNNSERLFCFAGIYDTWFNREENEHHSSFAIITSFANKLMQKIDHHRCPVVLDPNDYEAWLDTSLPLAEATSMLKPFADRNWNAYPVNNRIKSPIANDSELLSPAGQRIIPEYDFELIKYLELEGMGKTNSRQKKLDDDGQLSLF